MFSRRCLLEKGVRATAATLAFASRPSGGATTATTGGVRAGVTAAAIAGRGWGLGLGEGVHSAQAFGGPGRPLNRCGGVT